MGKSASGCMRKPRNGSPNMENLAGLAEIVGPIGVLVVVVAGDSAIIFKAIGS